MRHLHLGLLAAIALAGCSFGLDRDPAPDQGAAAEAASTEVVVAEATPEPEEAAAPTISDVSFGPGIGVENGRLVRTGADTWTATLDGQSFELVETSASPGFIALAQNGGLNLLFQIDLTGNQVLLSRASASGETAFPIKSAS